MTTQLTLKASIPDLVAARSKALAMLEEGMQTIKDALDLADNACVGDGKASYPLKEELVSGLKFGTTFKGTPFPERLRREMDRAMWRSFVVNTPLWGLMDTKARKDFDKSMEAVPPEASIENLATTMSHYFADADNIFRRSLVETFSNLDRNYRSHDGFKIGDRINLSGIQSDWGGFNHYATDRIRDLDRVFWTLDGKDYLKRYKADGSEAGKDDKAAENDLVTVLNCAFRDAGSGLKAGAGTCETDYFRVRFFKNRSVHIWFKRLDLVEKANRLIAEHFGDTVGAAPDVAGKAAPDPCKGVNPNAKEDFFATPADVAADMVKMAGIEAWEKVLEPSSGNGAILTEIMKAKPSEIVCIEKNAARASACRSIAWSHGDTARVSNSDFLEVGVDDFGQFNVIIMNPPFNSLQWVRHTLHAWKFLMPGGRLVALLPKNASAGKFDKEWLRLLKDGLTEVRDLPAGTFKEAGTMIETRIYVFEK